MHFITTIATNFAFDCCVFLRWLSHFHFMRFNCYNWKLSFWCDFFFRIFFLNCCWFNAINSFACSFISFFVHHSFFFFYVSNNFNKRLCKITQIVIHCIAYLYCFWLRIINFNFVKFCHRFFNMTKTCFVSICTLNNFLLNRLFEDKFFFEILYEMIMWLILLYVASLKKYFLNEKKFCDC